MRRLFLVLMMLSMLGSVSCKEKESNRTVNKSETNYAKTLDINSPEGLAKASGEVYKALSNQKISAEEAVETLKSYASKASLAEIRKRKAEFIKGIESYIETMKSNHDQIMEIEFAKTVYQDSDKASIERIQKHKQGKRYCFRQDFVFEEGKWKIGGDNIIDNFTIK